MMFSRRPGARFNRGRVACPGVAVSGEPAEPEDDGLGDDFEDGALASKWEFLNPAEDCSYAEADGEAQITVASGATHDLWTDNKDAPRIWQDVPDADFDIAVEFPNLPADDQSHGIGAFVSETAFYRFDLRGEGATEKWYFFAYIDGASQTQIANTQGDFAGTFLRLRRVGNVFTAYYGTDVESWTELGSEERAVAVAKVGIYGGNFSTNPEYVARAEQFIDLEA